MAVTTAIVQAAGPTGGGNQSFTSAGFGTPKAAMFLVTKGVTNGTVAADCVLSVGFTDGVRDRCHSSQAQDAVVSSSATDRSQEDDEVIVILDTAGAKDGEANFNAWVTDGVQITWGNAPNAAYLITCILFGGADLTAHVNGLVGNATLNGTASTTDPGFTPDLILASARLTDSTAAAPGSVQYHIGIGAAANITGLPQGAVGCSFRDAVSPQQSMSNIRNNRLTTTVLNGANFCSLEVTSYDANGFTVTTRDSTTGRAFYYLALRFGGVNRPWVGSVDIPNGTGNDPQTGPGWTPQLVMLLGSMSDTVNTLKVDGQGGAQSIAAFTASAAYSHAVASEDNVTNSNCQSLTANQALNFPEHNGAAGAVATFVSMDANGWTTNYSAVPSTVRKAVGIAIEADAAGGAVVPQIQRYRQMMGYT